MSQTQIIQRLRSKNFNLKMKLLATRVVRCTYVQVRLVKYWLKPVRVPCKNPGNLYFDSFRKVITVMVSVIFVLAHGKKLFSSATRHKARGCTKCARDTAPKTQTFATRKLKLELIQGNKRVEVSFQPPFKSFQSPTPRISWLSCAFFQLIGALMAVKKHTIRASCSTNAVRASNTDRSSS